MGGGCFYIGEGLYRFRHSHFVCTKFTLNLHRTGTTALFAPPKILLPLI